MSWRYDQGYDDAEEERKRREREEQAAVEQEIEGYSRQLNNTVDSAKSDCNYHYETVADIESTQYQWEQACQYARNNPGFTDIAGAFTTALAAIGTAISYWRQQKEDEERRKNYY